MTVRLASLAFDHQRGSPVSPTLPLRSGPVPLPVPEWTPADPSSAAVAFVLDRLHTDPELLAGVVIDAQPGTSVQIRALAVTAQPGPALPSLDPVPVTAGRPGEPIWRRIRLPAGPLRAAGAGAGTSGWIWQAQSAPDRPWVTFAETTHRVYVVPSPPTAPWTTTAAIPHVASWPSAEALEVACAWARGARDADTAAALITAAVNRLGGTTVSYDIAAGGPHYCGLLSAEFMLDLFLDRLSGGPGAGPLVNCSDCAAIVSTFANLLGADLWQSKMGLVGSGFGINPLIAIGLSDWSRLWGGFVFHEVAWTGNCAEDDAIYDACVLADADSDPASAPHRPALPAGTIFGAAGGYRDQVASAAGRAACVPQPSTRMRRSIVPVPVPVPVPVGVPVAIPGARVLPLSPAVETATRGRLNLLDAGAGIDAGSADQAARADRVAETVTSTTWWQPAGPASRLRIDSFVAPSADAARDVLLRIATTIQCPDLAPLPAGFLGDVAYSVPGGGLVMFIRADQVHVVRNVGAEPFDVTGDAQRLDGQLTQRNRARRHQPQT